MSFFESKTKYFVLTGVFFIALVISFILAQKKNLTDGFASSNLDNPGLPIVWALICDEKMNCMRGHISDVGYEETAETLNLLSEDRRLRLQIENISLNIKSISYEVRNAELDQLMEKTVVSDYTRESSVIVADLALQNLIAPETEYRLDFIIDTEEKGEIHYYSRIKISEDFELAGEMLKVAEDFSTRNFDYDMAKENTTYMETDGTADETDLAFTNLKSTFALLAYNGLKLTSSETKDIRLCEYDDNTGEIRYSYIAVRTKDEEKEYFQIDESFTMRQGTQRVYLMDYTRRIHEIYAGQTSNISGDRIVLGINDEDDIEVLNDEGDSCSYIVSGGDLWKLDRSEGSVASIFSFRSSVIDDIRTSYSKHDIHLLKMSDGQLYYIVYGYMNRGSHEGENGVSFMTYNPDTDVSDEVMFIPVDRSFEFLETDINQLAYLNDNNVLYIKLGKSIYSIDTKSGSSMEVVTGLKSHSCVINKDMDRAAWQSSDDIFGSEIINLMNLETGEKKEVRAEDGTLLKLDGFIGNDLSIRVCSENDKWVRNGKVSCIPARAVEILNDNLDVLKHYGGEDTYIYEVNVHDGRVNMTLYSKNSDGSFSEKGEDTLVSSDEAPDRLEGIGSYQSEDKLKVFYVELPGDVNTRNIKNTAAADIVLDGLDVTGVPAGEEDFYAAYGSGELTGIYSQAADAINAVYDKMGFVKYHDQIIYSRPATVTSRILERPYELAERILSERTNDELMDLRGITLKEALYFVSAKKPVLAWLSGGTPVLIYAYDKSIITCHNINTGEIMYLGIDEAEESIARAGRDYSCE